MHVDPPPTDAGLDHERLRDAVADLPRLLRIADQARDFYGPADCADGECDHVDGLQQCPLLLVRYATDALRHVGDLARHGLVADPATGLELFRQIADLAAAGAAHGPAAHLVAKAGQRGKDRR